MQSIKLQQVLPEVFVNKTSVVSDVWHNDITFKKGEYYLIEAASGTGKSSLCNFIYGSRGDYQGIINFDIKNINSLNLNDWCNIRTNHLSMMFQGFKMFQDLTVLENIEINNRLTKFKKTKEIISLLDELHIADKKDTKLKFLSFGQQQKAAFIRSLCQPYDFIILDEPISHLDEVNAISLKDILVIEATKHEAGVIITSIGKPLQLNYNNVFKL